MSLVDKANTIKELVNLVVTILPKIVNLIVEVCTMIREVKVNA